MALSNGDKSAIVELERVRMWDRKKPDDEENGPDLKAGAGEPDNVSIALVVHGLALQAFHASSADPDLWCGSPNCNRGATSVCGPDRSSRL